ncbi:beta strand repeat-containing protein [Gemmatimonas sp.]|uniref:beta strand repeat-containing protein n=1 Tax=Gemmatimonas sp. TaxID=1962908 RepID=UPI0037C170EF
MCSWALLAACAGAGDITAPATGNNNNRPAVAARIDLSVAAVGLGAIGASENISAFVRDANGVVIPSASISWSSADITIADVSGSGASATVTARASGRTTIRVTAGAVTQEIPITVNVVRSIALDAATQVRAGSIITLAPVIDAEPGATTALRWESADATIATVSGGVVTGVSMGSTTIRVSAIGDPRVSAVTQLTVNRPRSVSIANAPRELFIGDAQQFAATVDVDENESQALEWSSANPTVASVTSSGRVIATGLGTALIRVRSTTFADMTDSVTLAVRFPRSVTLTPSSATFGPGQTRQLNAQVQAEDGLSTALTWRSDNPTVAMVASNGMVTGLAQGTATITAVLSADSTRRGSATITIVPLVRDVDVQPSALTVATGDTRQLAVSVTADAGAVQDVQWRSGNPSVATVSNTGLVTGVRAGTVIITAVSLADTTRRSTALVTVRSIPTVTLTPTALTVEPGESATLTATVTADPEVNRALIWRTANAQVASVSSAGVVTATSMGTTTVTAISVADTTRRATATITVAILPGVRSVSVSPSAAAIVGTQSLQLSTTVDAKGGAPTSVTYRNSNPTVASVSASGLVSALSAGTTTITAVAVADTTRRSTSQITVRNAPTVALTPSTFSIEPGESRVLSATVQADPSVSTDLIWRSGNIGVATVSAAGIVSAVANGTTTITAISVADTTRRANATVTVAVVPTVLSVSVSPSAVALTSGQTTQLVPSVQTRGGASTAVTFNSSNPAVASVNVAGLVTALSNGTAAITVASTANPNISATVAVTVAPAATQLATSWTSTRLSGALHEDVVSFDGIDANSAFAVNSKGDVYRLSGGVWSLATRGATHSTLFQAVSATGVSNAIAVGTNGVIVRWDGSTWSAMSSGVTQTLNGIFLDGAQSGFAVGAGGVALRFSSGTWSSTNTTSTQALNGVWVSGGTAVAVGANGELLRWNGSTWTRQSSGTTQTLNSVFGISTTDIMAVGSFGTVRRWNGTTWSAVNGGNVTDDLHGIVGSTANANRYWVAGDEGVYAVDGSTVARVTTSYAPRLSAASIDAAGSVWVSGQRGIVQHLSNGLWDTQNIAPDLIDVWSTSTTNAWAVGEFGFVYRWNGSSWVKQNTPTTATLNAVWGASSTEAFAGGENGTMLRWNGSSWTAMTIPSSGSVYGLWGSGASNVFASMSTGEVLRFNGSSWSSVTTQSNALWSVSGSAANDVYATGENGTVLRFNGTSWTTMNVSTAGTIGGLWSAGASNLLAVGAAASGTGGIAFRNTGTVWTSLSLPTSTFLTSVWGVNANDVYATGDNGTILRWNGTSWSSMATGTTDQLWSVSGAPAGNGAGFAVGYNSTLVAATSSGGMVVSGYRALVTSRGADLDPQVGARLVRGPLPEGKARDHRKGGR